MVGEVRFAACRPCFWRCTIAHDSFAIAKSLVFVSKVMSHAQIVANLMSNSVGKSSNIVTVLIDGGL
eukprot:08688.XXX_317337_317537_1 [CDS] Oithona nana genome sequencing.